MRSGQNPAADARRHLGSGRRRRRLARLLPLVAAWPRGNLACAPSHDPGHRGCHSDGRRVPVLEEDVPTGQNQTRPPMYEMGGLARHRHARSGQLPGLAGATRRPPVPSIRARDPVSRLLPRSPGSPPRWCPFPTVRAFLLPPRTPRKSLRSIITDFSAIHTVSTERMQLSAPDGDYPPANSQAVHKSPCVAPRTPGPVVAHIIGRPFHCIFPDNHPVPGTG
jgi:hypothetical protein